MSAPRPFAALTLTLALVLTGCGTPGAPLPPSLNLPQPVSDLSAVRVGNQVNVSFQIPTENTDHLPLKNLGFVNFEQCRNLGPSTCAVIRQWKPGALKPGALVSFTIALPQEDYVGVSLRNDRGATAGRSNQVYLPHQPAWPNLQSVSAKATADAVVLTLTNSPPQPAPAGEHSYRIQRSQAAQKNPQQLADIPATQTEFRDTHFDWQQRYTYEVHTVNRVTDPSGNAIEFESGPPVNVSLETNDVFPPAIPTGLAAIFNGTLPNHISIDLSWLPNSTPDLAGYNLYRSRDGAAPEKITPSPLSAPDFRDFYLQPGADYSYSVTAVDVRGNESPRSTAATEHVPRQP